MPASPAGILTTNLYRFKHNGHKEKNYHINKLELLAVIKDCKAFKIHLTSKMVQLAMDNLTTMYYILKQGGTHSPSLLYLAVDFWECCLAHHVCLTAIYIASQDNNLADLLNPKESQAHKWELDQSVFLSLCKCWGTPTIDLFASRNNQRCKHHSCTGVGKNSHGDAFVGCCCFLVRCVVIYLGMTPFSG